MARTLFCVLLAVLAPSAQTTPPRTWTDSTGNYAFEADLLGYSSDTVVLQRRNRDKDLVSLPIDKLSKEDQEFLKSKEASDSVAKAGDEPQLWTMRSGLKVTAKVIEYGRRDVTIQRRRGKTYVNDRVLSNSNDVQRKIIARSVGYFEKAEIDDENDLEKWIIKLQGKPRTYTANCFA
jgi:hypothetical protein